MPSEKLMSKPAVRLDSQKLSCLQRMGITVWQRRSAAAPTTQSALPEPVATKPVATSSPTVSSQAGPAASANAVEPATVQESPSAHSGASQRSALLQMNITTAESDRAIEHATALLARASLPDVDAAPFQPDEYQLLIKMMDSIGIQAGNWIAVHEADSLNKSGQTETGHSVATLGNLLDSSRAAVLLLLLPATELAHWSDYWNDIHQDGNNAAQQSPEPDAPKTLSIANGAVLLAPLCDPRDLLQNGALKRNAWECLKVVREHLARP